jgi:hypothetical protein
MLSLSKYEDVALPLRQAQGEGAVYIYSAALAVSSGTGSRMVTNSSAEVG